MSSAIAMVSAWASSLLRLERGAVRPMYTGWLWSHSVKTPGCSGTSWTHFSTNRRRIVRVSWDKRPRAGVVPFLVARTAISLCASGRRRSLLAAENIDPGKNARRCGVAAMDRLVRLALAAVLRAVHLVAVGAARRPQAPPERRRDAAVIGILYHPFPLPALDELAPLATELELVSRVVYGPRHVGAHEHAALDRRDHLFEPARARLDVQVRHAVDRRPVPAAGARVRSAGQAGAVLRKLPAERREQHSVFDQPHLL